MFVSSISRDQNKVFEPLNSSKKEVLCVCVKVPGICYAGQCSIYMYIICTSLIDDLTVLTGKIVSLISCYFTTLVGTPGFKMRIGSPYPHVRRNRRLKAYVTIMTDFSPEFNPPFRWRSKHQTKKWLFISIIWPLLSFEMGPVEVQGN